MLLIGPTKPEAVLNSNTDEQVLQLANDGVENAKAALATGHEAQATAELVHGADGTEQRAPSGFAHITDLAEGPPELKPLSNSAINVKMANDAKIVYETIGKLAGFLEAGYTEHRDCGSRPSTKASRL